MKKNIFLLISVFLFSVNAFSFDLNDFMENVKSQGDYNYIDKNEFKIDINDVIKSTETEKVQSYEEYELDYSQKKWNKVRKYIEEGKSFDYEKTENVNISSITVSTQPATLPPQVQFVDSGTSLHVTGRKVISVSYSGKKYLNEQTNVTRERSTSLFDIKQEMQIRMQGKVGDKINVNIDYDDTKEDKQDISVTYQGDPQEVVQNISFGDIDLSLPATEFVSYNKQLFGIRADLKSKRFKATFIGSRTKGQTKTKRFVGNTQFQTVDIQDVNYIRRKYYDITFGTSSWLPIKGGSERIYIDQQTSEPADGVIITTMTADDLNVITSTYTGKFKLLNPGIDYAIDYNKGLVIFNRNLNPQDVVIIDYQKNDGTWLRDENGTGLPKILKTENDIFISTSSEAGWKNELKTYYFIGQTNIVRDDGNGNFILKIQDLNKQELNYGPKYPDNIEVDFEQGIIHLLEPFPESPNSSEPDPQTYSQSPVAKRILHVEYYYRLKTFYLEPNIVPNSEVIKLDGLKLIKNQDYYIDYDMGFLTFYYPDRIRPDSIIDITYELKPFGGSNQTLVGGRVSYDISNNFSIGSTVLYQGSAKAKTSPNINEITSSLLVYDGDVQINNLNLFGIKTKLSAEIAQSRLNPNINDYAIIDNMEGIKQEDTASLDKNYWYIASNPSGIPSEPNSLTWDNEEIDSTEINPNSPSNTKQQILTINYDFSVSTEVSLVYVFSQTGLDFSQKNSFELTVKGDSTNGPLINLHFGEINEDSDNSGGMTLNCSNGQIIYNAPKTEDINCDGILSPSEDIGWLYAPSGFSPKRFGANNGKIDTQDLDGNGRLDSGNPFVGGSFGYVSNTYFIDITSNNAQTDKINFTGWHNLVYPVVIASSDSYKWTNIKQVRITLKKDTNTPVKGTIKIARIAAVGNTWNISLSTSSSEELKTLAVNNVDNTDYIPIYNAGGEITDIYNKLYGSVKEQKSTSNSNTILEQALAITYSSVTSNSSSYIYKRFSKPIDISQHKELKFILYNKSVDTNNNFYLKFGDVNNYYMVEVPLDFTGWKLISINQIDSNKDNVADTWESFQSGIIISTSGNVSLQQIPQIIAGFKPTDVSTHSGTVYLNDIFLSKPIIRTGNARKIEGNFEIPGFATFGGKHKFIDRNFQTPVSAITNQDNEENTMYLNLSKPKFFPTSYSFSKQITNTPNVYNTGNNNLVNSLEQGKVEKINLSANGLLNLWILPKTNLTYSRNYINYNSINREDDKHTFSASTNYTLPLRLFILPRNIDMSYNYTINKITYDATKLINTQNYYNSDERTNNYSIKANFSPLRNIDITPSYSLNRVYEKRTSLSDNSSFKFPKSMQQSVSLNANLKLLKWFSPNINYSVNTIENNNINITTVTLAQQSTTYNVGEIKTVNRNAQGSINLTLNISDLWPQNKILRSMSVTSNYQLQDGDVWQNVEKGYNTKTELWIRNPLKPKNPFAQRTSATLRDTYNITLRWQPLEAFTFRNPRLRPLSTLSITNNYIYSKQDSYSNQTFTQTVNKTLPDMVISISQLEDLFGVSKWAKYITNNIRYSRNENLVKNTSLETSNSLNNDLRFNLLNFINTSINFTYNTKEQIDLKLNQRVSFTRRKALTVQGTFNINAFTFTPKIDYSNDYAEGTLKTVTQNTTIITPSILVKTDIKLPTTFKLPFLNKTTFDNRIIWTNNISYTIKKSPISINDNNRLLSLTSNADIQATQNLRIGFNLTFQRYWHKYLKQEEYFAYQIGTNVILQF